MALRKALAYSKRHFSPYTRKSSVKSKNYIKSVPQIKLSKFKMGDIGGYEKGKFNIIINLVSGENILIRDNALEAARQYIHKILEEEALGQYYFEVRLYPHHILRENKVLTGAGADRLQTGMAHSFGSVVGRAAIVKENSPIFLVAVNSEKARKIAIKSIERIKAKLPCHSRILTEKK